MNHIFKEYLRKFVLVFFDDILIYNKGGEEHLQHLKKVIEVLKQHSYVLNRKKCVLGASRIEYLGHYLRRRCQHGYKEGRSRHQLAYT